MDLILYALAAAILLALAVRLARLRARRPTAGALCALLVTLGLVYDNGVIALGGAIGTGPTLVALNGARFVVHAFATPLLIVFALGAAVRADLGWARRPAVRAAFWLLALALIAYGVAFELLPTTLEPVRGGGVLRYRSAEGGGVPVPAVVTNLALIGVGIALWRARGWPWLAAAGLLAAAGFAAAPFIPSPSAFGQLAEVALIGGIVATEGWLQGKGGSGGGPRSGARMRGR